MSRLNILDRNICRMIIGVLRLDVRDLSLDTTCHQKGVSCSLAGGNWFDLNSECWGSCPYGNPHHALIVAIRKHSCVFKAFDELIRELHSTENPQLTLAYKYSALHPELSLDDIIKDYLTEN